MLLSGGLDVVVVLMIYQGNHPVFTPQTVLISPTAEPGYSCGQPVCVHGGGRVTVIGLRFVQLVTWSEVFERRKRISEHHPHLKVQEQNSCCRKDMALHQNWHLLCKWEPFCICPKPGLLLKLTNYRNDYKVSDGGVSWCPVLWAMNEENSM